MKTIEGRRLRPIAMDAEEYRKPSKDWDIRKMLFEVKQ
jgi:hypothetical protein